MRKVSAVYRHHSARIKGGGIGKNPWNKNLHTTRVAAALAAPDYQPSRIGDPRER